MTDLLIIVLVLWGLTAGLFYLHRRRTIHGEIWFLILLGAVLASGAWLSPVVKPVEIHLVGLLPAGWTISPRLIIPAVFACLWAVYVADGSLAAAWLILGLFSVQVVAGIIIPAVSLLSARSDILSPVPLNPLLRPDGLRATLSHTLALLVGMYALVVVYQALANRVHKPNMSLLAALSLLLSGWAEGSLYAFGSSWGTAAWPSALYAQWTGWSLAAVALWPVLGIYLRRIQTGTGLVAGSRQRPVMGIFRHTLAMREALQQSQYRLSRLDERVRLQTDIRRLIVRAEDPAPMLEKVCRRLVQAGVVEVVWLALIGDHPGEFGPTAQAGRDGGFLGELGLPQRAGDLDASPAAEALRTHQPVVIQDINRQPDSTAWRQPAVSHRLASAAAVPIVLGETSLGVLCAYRRVPEAFDGETVRLLASVADDVGYGLRKLTLERDMAQRVRDLGLLRDVSLGLAGEHDVPSLLGLMIERAQSLLDAAGGAVFQLEEGGQRAGCAAYSGSGTAYRNLQVMKGQGPVGRVLAGARPVAYVGKDPSLAGDEEENAFLVEPLRSKDEVGGAVVVMREAARPFNVNDQTLLGLLVALATSAIENARFIEAQQRRSAELEALRQASLSMTSNLELKAALSAILEQALKLVDAWDAHIFLYDGERLQFASAMWAGDVQQEPFATPREQGLTYTVARTGKRIVVADARTDPMFKDAPWGGAIAGTPLRAKRGVVGVMNVAYQTPHNFSEEELHILELLADQASVVLENAALFERTAADRRRLQLLYDITRELSASTDPDAILQRSVELTTQNLGGMMGSINLVQPGSDRLVLRGFTGYEGWEVGDLQRRLDMRIGKGFLGWVAHERQAAWASDVRKDSRWEPVPGVDDGVGSALGAPIIADGELLGVMLVLHKDIGVFEQAHLDMLVAICRQVALAWSNAQRFGQIDRRLAELTVVQQAAQVINQWMEMQPLLEEIVEQVRSSLGYTYVGIALVDDEDLVLMASRGHEGGKIRFSIQEGITGRVVRTNQPALVPDVDRDPDFVRYFPESRSELAVPIRKGDLVIGVLNVESPVLDGLSQDDLRLLLLLADQLAVALENSALYERLRRHSAELETTVAARTAELARALELAQAADRLKTQFVSDVSHELRTPLSNIRLYVELLRQAPPARHPEYIDTLERETERLVTLIEDLLSISRLDAGSAPAVLNQIDLNTMARALVEDRQKLFSERGLDLSVVASRDPVHVMADENLIAQVIGNLMTNAMHYTPSGGRVTVQTRTGDEDGWVTLSVTDTGLGILPDEQASLFDRFFRGSASRKMGNPGTGLGLAISKEIVARHGGLIKVSSRPGQGSTMTIYLPAMPPPVPEGSEGSPHPSLPDDGTG